MPNLPSWIAVAACVLLASPVAAAHHLRGNVADSTGLALANVWIEARSGAVALSTFSDAQGSYELEKLPPGVYRVTYRLPGFATVVRNEVVPPRTAAEASSVTLQPALTADVIVSARRTFRDLAEIEDAGASLLGVASAASEGVVGAARLHERPAYRPGDLLEAVPGVVVTQHSGEGKANQYYLRGFNIDHGTDLATTVAGIPVNLPTHAHGQGYSDLNFLIPELVSGVQFRKGLYFADEGDFATAGSIHVSYLNVLERPFVKVEGGGGPFVRAVAAGSSRLGAGHLLYAGESSHDDGPWVNPEGHRKWNGVLRYSRGGAQHALSVTSAFYDARWNATDQAPRRAVESGAMERFGAVDPSDGGLAQRLALSGEWRRSSLGGRTDVKAYAVHHRLRLFSNFTYFLDDPERGDQFEQEDRRLVDGLKVSHRWLPKWGRDVENNVGLEVREDHIPTVALHHTWQRRRLSTLREDAVRQRRASAFAESAVQWSPWLRTVVGLRADVHRLDVEAMRESVTTSPGWRPKLSAVLGPWSRTELYLNAGTGFHSNDARSVAPAAPGDASSGTAVTPVAAARGAEIGVRTTAVRNLHSTLTAWALDLASELVFVGDAGTTEVRPASRRTGLEWTSYWRAAGWLALDADVSYSRARYREAASGEDRIPGSVGLVGSGGLTFGPLHGVSGSLRLRHIGARPLTEDGAVRSTASTIVNGRIGWALSRRYEVALDVVNLTNAAADDIEYFYVSRLPDEPAEGVADVHAHPLEPRTLRIGLRVTF